MDKIHLWIPGRPKATQTGSIAVTRGRAFPLRRNAPWSALVGLMARQQWVAGPLAGPLKVEVRFVFARPKGVSARQRPHPITRPDAENCWKGIGDVLEGVCWRDDAQIVDLRLVKEYAEDGRVGVAVTVEAL